jgi:hypothetical protein
MNVRYLQQSIAEKSYFLDKNKKDYREADSRSAGQEITEMLWDQQRVHKNASLVHIVSQINPVHTLVPLFH